MLRGCLPFFYFLSCLSSSSCRILVVLVVHDYLVFSRSSRIGKGVQPPSSRVKARFVKRLSPLLLLPVCLFSCSCRILIFGRMLCLSCTVSCINGSLYADSFSTAGRRVFLVLSLASTDHSTQILFSTAGRRVFLALSLASTDHSMQILFQLQAVVSF